MVDYGWLASEAGAHELREARQEQPGGLAALQARVAHDLACLNYPPANWVPECRSANGERLLDVLVAGAGMCGQTVAYALRREGVLHQSVIDARPEGEEGPWATFARMEMLRSPKHLTGPDLGVPSLTFRAWYEARFGAAAWESLHKVWRLDWRDYLLWVREQVGVVVSPQTRLVCVEPGESPAEGLRVVLQRTARAGAPGQPERWVRRVRHLVLALGREGAGQPRWPVFPSLGPRETARAAAQGRLVHSMDPVDPQDFRAARVGVLGAAASAFDNAAIALEHGARSVVMFSRRAHLPQVNRFKGSSYPGFFRGYWQLPAAERLRFHAALQDPQVPPPFESVLRCQRHEHFSLRFGEPWLDVALEDSAVKVTTAAGEYRFDRVILGTGFDVNLIDRDELAGLAPWVATWGDRAQAGEFDPPPDSPSWPEMARFPTLDDSFALMARPGAPTALAQALSRIHLFSWGSTLSHGSVSGDIPGLAIGATRLASALCARLFGEDAPLHLARLQAFDEPELQPTRWWVNPTKGSPT